MDDKPRPYIVNLGNGEIAGGPGPGLVQHCNSGTDYELIKHEYDPDNCIFCMDISQFI